MITGTSTTKRKESAPRLRELLLFPLFPSPLRSGRRGLGERIQILRGPRANNSCNSLSFLSFSSLANFLLSAFLSCSTSSGDRRAISRRKWTEVSSMASPPPNDGRLLAPAAQGPAGLRAASPGVEPSVPVGRRASRAPLPPCPCASPPLSSSRVQRCGGGLRRGPLRSTDAHAATRSAVVDPCDDGHSRRRSQTTEHCVTCNEKRALEYGCLGCETSSRVGNTT